MKMKRTMRWSAVATTVLAMAPPGLAAQAGPMRGGPGGRDRQGVEQVMRLRERLGLTEEQVGRLDEIRREQVAERSERQARTAELRSRVLAGQAEGEELREALRAEREALTSEREGRRERVLAVLDQAQRDSLQQLGARAQAFRMGRDSALRGRPGRQRPGGGRPGLGFGRRRGFEGVGPRGFLPGRQEGFGPRLRGMDGFGPPEPLRGPRIPGRPDAPAPEGREAPPPPPGPGA